MPTPTHDGVWRKPSEETEDFPGLVVHDSRVTGSITTGQSRLPLWCLITTALVDGWAEVEDNWGPSKYGWDKERLAAFLYYLLEARGEFGRLLCILADVERREQQHMDDEVEALADKQQSNLVQMPPEWRTPVWWKMPEQRQRVIDQLRRCLDALTDE